MGIRNWVPHLLILYLAGWCQPVFGQQVINKAYPVEGRIYLTESISIPRIAPGYTLWMPEDGTARGLILFTRPRRDTVPDAFINYSLENDLAVLYACTDNFLEFFFSAEKMQEIEGYLQEALSEKNIPKENLLFCGMSLEGTRALKLAAFAHSWQSRHRLAPAALAICDAPLDMIRFHRSSQRAEELKVQEAAANEGTWVSAYLEDNLGGTPTENPAGYLSYSPYAYLRTGNHYLQHLQNTPIRAYTEPDVQWWMETRRKSYYDMNSVDLAGLINELKLLGNERAELITTTGKGYKPDGSRHPHSWSIVDEKELIDWFVGILGN